MIATKSSVVMPYANEQSSKKDQVARMFDSISGKYDFLNHFLSLGIDKRWRKRAIAMLADHAPRTLLDVATGTGDFAIQALTLNPDHITGVDISKGMLEIGRKKIKDRGYSKKIDLVLADSEALPFPDNHFDAVTVAFGVRNFENLDKGLSEILRVLKEGGRLVILEFSKPRNIIWRFIYQLYFNRMLPTIGRWFSKDKTAYSYLPQSVQAFPDGLDFVDILSKVGYNNIICKPLTLGVSSIYVASK